MSYDLYLISAEHGADPASFLEELEEDVPSDTVEAEDRKRAVVSALRRIDPSLEPFAFDYDEIARITRTTVEEARRNYSHVELNGADESNGIQVTVNGNYASVTIAYWHSDAKAPRVFSVVERYISEIVIAGHYRIYDPQLERVVDAFGDIRDDVLKKYAGVMEQVPAIAQRAAHQPRPWWKFW